MAHPNFAINIWALVTCFVAAFSIGGLWYGPLFGKAWARQMGWQEGATPPPGAMKKAMVLQVIGLVLMVYVLVHALLVWFPSSWGVGEDGPPGMYGFQCALWTWLGFYVPLQLNKVGWEMRPWKLFFINAGHDFVVLQVLCQILARWR